MNLVEYLDEAQRPVLLWSGGNDSTLLLVMLRELGRPFDILQMRDFWNKEQKEQADFYIRKWNLKVFSYPSATTSLIGEGDEISAVFEYAIGNSRMPFFKDIVTGTRCIAELQGQHLERSPVEWTHYIIGSKKCDRHYAMDSLVPSERWKIGNAEMYAPLYEMTDQEVKDALFEYGIKPKKVDEGNVEFCTKCLHGVETYCPLEQKVIPPVQWSPEQNLINFRAAYGSANPLAQTSLK